MANLINKICDLFNLSMMAYMIEIQYSLIFKTVKFTILSQVAKLNSVYIFIV